MSEETLPPHVKYWLSPETKYDCYFTVGPESGPKERIGSFKSFLCGYSEPFRSMLQDSDIKEQGDVTIIDIQPDTFKNFLKCLYMNCENLSKSELSFPELIDLLYVVDKYLVIYVKDKLVDVLIYILQESLTLDHVFIALSSQVFLNEKSLQQSFCKIIESRKEEIFSSPSFFNISSESLLWILKLENIGSDLELWHKLLKWAIHQTGSKDGTILRQHMLKHLKFIQFHAMNLEDFCQYVVCSDVLTETEVYDICKSVGQGTLPNIKTLCSDITFYHKSKEPSEIKFSFCVNNISNFSGEILSNYYKFLGLDWAICVRKTDDNYLSVFLYTKSFSLYECSVEVRLTLIARKPPSLTLFFDRKFSDTGNITQIHSHGCPNFCHWDDILNPNKNYVLLNNCIILVAHIKTLSYEKDS